MANYEICSNEYEYNSMKYFTCPYQDDICGNNGSSMRQMSPDHANSTNPGNYTVFSVADRRFRNY